MLCPQKGYLPPPVSGTEMGGGRGGSWALRKDFLWGEHSQRGSLLFHLQILKRAKPLSQRRNGKKVLLAVSEHSLLESVGNALSVLVLGERDPGAGLIPSRPPRPLLRPFPGRTRCQKFTFQKPSSPSARRGRGSRCRCCLHPAQELLFGASVAVRGFCDLWDVMLEYKLKIPLQKG